MRGSRQSSRVDGVDEGRSDRALLELAPLALAEAAPDAEALVVRQRVLEAFAADVAGETHLLRLPGRSALLRGECFRIGLGAQSPLLPAEDPAVPFVHQFRHDLCQFLHLKTLLDPVRVSASPTATPRAVRASAWPSVKPGSPRRQP